MKLLAYVSDLMFRTEFREVAAHSGGEVTFAKSLAQLKEKLGEQLPDVAVVDLCAKEGALDAISHLRAEHPGLRLIAFYPHVAGDLAEQARGLGLTEVLPRSKFIQLLPKLFV